MAADASFGRGWPECNRFNIVTLSRKDGLRLPLHYALVELVAILIDLTEMMGYDVKPSQTWGFACRQIRNTGVPSLHSWGTAIDINAVENPRRRPLTTNLPHEVVALWEGHGFRWGGRWSYPDAMHFEFTKSTYEAGAIHTRLKTFLQGHGGKVKPLETPQHPSAFSDQQANTMELQKLLRVTPDGVVGPKTIAAMKRNMIGWHRNLPGNRNPALVRWLQRQGNRKGIPCAVDGIVGPEVNHLIVKVLGQADGICGPKGYQAALR